MYHSLLKFVPQLIEMNPFVIFEDNFDVRALNENGKKFEKGIYKDKAAHNRCRSTVLESVQSVFSLFN